MAINRTKIITRLLLSFKAENTAMAARLIDGHGIANKLFRAEYRDEEMNLMGTAWIAAVVASKWSDIEFSYSDRFGQIEISALTKNGPIYQYVKNVDRELAATLLQFVAPEYELWKVPFSELQFNPFFDRIVRGFREMVKHQTASMGDANAFQWEPLF